MVRQRHIDNTWPVAALTARSEAKLAHNRDFCLPHLHQTGGGGSSRNIAMPFGMKKLEWRGYQTVKRCWRYSFWHNPRTWETDGQADRPHYIASRGKNQLVGNFLKMYSMGRYSPPRGVPYFCVRFLVTDISATVVPIGVKFVKFCMMKHVSLGVAPRGESITNKNMLHFWAFLQYHLWQTPDRSCVVERHLCITRRRSTQSATYRASVDGTLLPAVMDRIFIDNSDFYTPPALLHPLKRGRRCCT